MTGNNTPAANTNTGNAEGASDPANKVNPGVNTTPPAGQGNAERGNADPADNKNHDQLDPEGSASKGTDNTNHTGTDGKVNPVNHEVNDPKHSDDTKPQSAQKAEDEVKTGTVPGTNDGKKVEQNSQAEADKLNAADKKAGRKVSKEEADRRKAAATDPNKSVTDPDFDADGKAQNPDSPVATPDLENETPLDGDHTADEAVKAGKPLSAETGDNLKSGHAELIKRAKLRVKEIDSTLEKRDPAAYKQYVERELGYLTNDNPDAKEAITKHWNNQHVA